MEHICTTQRDTSEHHTLYSVYTEYVKKSVFFHMRLVLQVIPRVIESAPLRQHYIAKHDDRKNSRCSLVKTCAVQHTFTQRSFHAQSSSVRESALLAKGRFCVTCEKR